MKNRIWTGVVRNRPDMKIDIRYFVDDNELMVNRYTENGLEDATKISWRPCENGKIWVATFDDLSEILVNWREDDLVTIAYRGLSYEGWQAPAYCVEEATA